MVIANIPPKRQYVKPFGGPTRLRQGTCKSVEMNMAEYGIEHGGFEDGSALQLLAPGFHQVAIEVTPIHPYIPPTCRTPN